MGPSLLLPRAEADDREVIRIAGVSVRKSHLYDRLYEHDPLWTKQEVDRIVFDILLARAARDAEIFVDEKMVDATVSAAEARLEKQVKADWGIKMTLDRFLLENRGLSRPLYHQLSRRRVARTLLRYYVVRYLAGREDRVRVRIISHRNRDTIQRIYEKVRDGADFRSLALRESEHSTQRRGGLLPAFSRASKAIYAKPAFELKPGGVSPILSATNSGVTYYYILYCVERLPGRNLPFKEVKAELDADRIKNPLSEEEKLDLYERLRSASESLPKPTKKG